MKVLILSDSLTLPRNNGDDQILDFKETWPNLLRNSNNSWDIVSVGIGSATTEDILYQTQYWTGFKADIVLVQIGLCDALPRALARWEVELLKAIPGAKIWKKLIKKFAFKLRRLRKLTLVRPKDFVSNLKQISEAFDNVLFLSIADAGCSPVHMPGATQKVKEYNDLLRKTVETSFVDLGGLSAENFMSDFYHLNSKGHRGVLEVVQKKLDEKAMLI